MPEKKGSDTNKNFCLEESLQFCEKRDITLINKEAKEKWGQGGRYDNGLNRTVPASVLSTN